MQAKAPTAPHPVPSGPPSPKGRLFQKHPGLISRPGRSVRLHFRFFQLFIVVVSGHHLGYHFPDMVRLLAAGQVQLVQLFQEPIVVHLDGLADVDELVVGLLKAFLSISS